MKWLLMLFLVWHVENIAGNPSESSNVTGEVTQWYERPEPFVDDRLNEIQRIPTANIKNIFVNHDSSYTIIWTEEVDKLPKPHKHKGPMTPGDWLIQEDGIDNRVITINGFSGHGETINGTPVNK